MNNPCPECSKDLIQVSEMNNIKFFSCENSKCVYNAELLMNVGDIDKPSYVMFHEMVQAMNSMHDMTREDKLLLLGKE